MDFIEIIYGFRTILGHLLMLFGIKLRQIAFPHFYFGFVVFAAVYHLSLFSTS